MSEADKRSRLRLLCENSSFDHKDEVIERIDSGGVVDWGDGDGVPVRSMLDIYERRLNRGRSVYRDTEHANRLLYDIEAYLGELRQVPGDTVRLWHVTADSPFSYSLFEGVTAGRILGCLYVADKREVPDKMWWDKLWGTEGLNELSDRT